jgi:hypothetical protein
MHKRKRTLDQLKNVGSFRLVSRFVTRRVEMSQIGIRPLPCCNTARHCGRNVAVSAYSLARSLAATLQRATVAGATYLAVLVPLQTRDLPRRVQRDLIHLVAVSPENVYQACRGSGSGAVSVRLLLACAAAARVRGGACRRRNQRWVCGDAPLFPAVARKLPSGCHENSTGPRPWYEESILNNRRMVTRSRLFEQGNNSQFSVGRLQVSDLESPCARALYAQFHKCAW